MADAVLVWLRNVAVFFLFMTAVQTVLSENQYRKYVQFFLGIVMILVLCRPLLAAADLDETLEQTWNRLTLEEEVKAMENGQLKVEGFQEHYLYQAYEKEIEMQIRMYLEEMGISGAAVEVELEAENQVKRICIQVGKGEESIYREEQKQQEEELQAELEEAKKELAKVYQADPAHIIVEIRG